MDRTALSNHPDDVAQRARIMDQLQQATAQATAQAQQARMGSSERAGAQAEANWANQRMKNVQENMGSTSAHGGISAAQTLYNMGYREQPRPDSFMANDGRSMEQKMAMANGGTVRRKRGSRGGRSRARGFAPKTGGSDYTDTPKGAAGAAAPQPQQQAAPLRIPDTPLSMMGPADLSSEQLPMMRLQDFADGGMIEGPGSGTSDSIETEKDEGTFIMPADSTRTLGKKALNNLAKVPVRLSNGEFEFTPEQTHNIGAAVLTALKDATHTPVDAGSSSAKAPKARGFALGGMVPFGSVGSVARAGSRDIERQSAANMDQARQAEDLRKSGAIFNARLSRDAALDDMTFGQMEQQQNDQRRYASHPIEAGWAAEERAAAENMRRQGAIFDDFLAGKGNPMNMFANGGLVQRPRGFFAEHKAGLNEYADGGTVSTAGMYYADGSPVGAMGGGGGMYDDEELRRLRRMGGASGDLMKTAGGAMIGGPAAPQRQQISPSNIFPQGHPSAGANVYGGTGVELGSSGKFAKVPENIGHQPGRQAQQPNSFGDAEAAAKDPTIKQVAALPPAPPPAARGFSPAAPAAAERTTQAPVPAAVPAVPSQAIDERTPAFPKGDNPQAQAALNHAEQVRARALATGSVAPQPAGAEPARGAPAAPVSQAQVQAAYDAWQQAKPGWYQQSTPPSAARERAAEAAYGQALQDSYRSSVTQNVPTAAHQAEAAAARNAPPPGGPSQPNPTDQRLAAGTQTAPRSRGERAGQDFDRTGMTNAQVAEANPQGQVRVSRQPNGTMSFSGEDVRGAVSYTDEQGNALPGGGPRGRGFARVDSAPAGSTVAMDGEGNYAFATSGSGMRSGPMQTAAAQQPAYGSRGFVPALPAGMTGEQMAQYAREVEAARTNARGAQIAENLQGNKSLRDWNDLRSPVGLARRNLDFDMKNAPPDRTLSGKQGASGGGGSLAQQAAAQAYGRLAAVQFTQAGNEGIIAENTRRYDDQAGVRERAYGDAREQVDYDRNRQAVADRYDYRAKDVQLEAAQRMGRLQGAYMAESNPEKKAMYASELAALQGKGQPEQQPRWKTSVVPGGTDEQGNRLPGYAVMTDEMTGESRVINHGAAGKALPAPPAKSQRVVGHVYQTSKGPMRWTAQGFTDA